MLVSGRFSGSREVVVEMGFEIRQDLQHGNGREEVEETGGAKAVGWERLGIQGHPTMRGSSVPSGPKRKAKCVTCVRVLSGW